MWNYAGWDGLSTVAGDIDNPQVNYPKALAICIPMITLIYLIPTVISLAVVGTADVEWTAGAFTTVAEEVGGAWLGLFLSLAAIVSAIGLFSAWLLSYSRIPFALAERRVPPGECSPACTPPATRRSSRSSSPPPSARSSRCCRSRSSPPCRCWSAGAC